jgi:hypothetical protein
MAEPRSFVLTDVLKRIWQPEFELLPKKVGMSDVVPWSIRKFTLKAGLSQGVDIIEVNNGLMNFTVLPSRGMGVWQAQYHNLRLGWDSPVNGPVHPSFVNLNDRGGIGWLYGFDEMICRCGLESNGAPCRDTVINNNGNPVDIDLTLHGKIANQPASYVEIRVIPGSPVEIVIIGRTCETGLFCAQLEMVSTISTKVHSNSFKIHDKITNLKSTESEMELLYHCNFGSPVLEKGSVLEIPAKTVAPRDKRATEGIDTYAEYLEPTSGYIEQCYFYEPIGNEKGDTLALLRNSTADRGVAVRFNTNELPCFTQWKNTGSESDGYVTGLEPGINYPNPRPFEREQGRVKKLEPGGSCEASISVEALNSKTRVQKTQKEIEEIKKGLELKVYNEPVRGYSAA